MITPHRENSMTKRRVKVRDMPDRSRVVANCELRLGGGPLSPGFSVTGEIYEAHGTWSGAARQNNGREFDAGGMIHDDILRAFPALAPLVALHLSDPNGTPMHAEANGWYFYSQGNRDLANQMLRVRSIPEGLSREEFAEFVDAQKERWANEAKAGRKILESL